MEFSDTQQKFVFANWKMSQSRQSAELFLNSWSSHSSRASVALFPSFVHLEYVFSFIRQRGLALSVGAQDCSTELEGAFTGEVSAQQIREIGAQFVLIGHSERRQRVPETPGSLTAKLGVALKAKLQPVFCIGETEAERLAGATNQVLSEQLKVIESHANQVIVAYEPVWAIGTGKVASVADVHAAHAFIRSKCSNLRAVIYGGSVKPSNSKDLAQIEGVDGFLVGGASLDANSLEKILQSAL